MKHSIARVPSDGLFLALKSVRNFLSKTVTILKLRVLTMILSLNIL